jgi:transposase-like protein
MLVPISGKRMSMRRVVDKECVILDVLVQKRHLSGRLRSNSRVESSHLPARRRARTMHRFKSRGQAQRFVSIPSAIYQNFYIQRHLIARKPMRLFQSAAMAEWNAASTEAA